MKTLLVYPEYPETFWSFKYALKFVLKKAAFPPLSLLTIAAMLPESWDQKLVDLNVTKLKDKDLLWADYVFISAMEVQKESVKKIVTRCHQLNVKMVAGGPMFVNSHENYNEIHHFILGEAEQILPLFITDILNGTTRHIYHSENTVDLKTSPVPKWNLINFKNYASLNIQYSRGCPFDCEFCNITTLFGHKVRTKSREQIIVELDEIYSSGWRGEVFFVDDNFIGNKNKLKKDILPAIIEWNEKHQSAFIFNTQASMELSDDEELLNLMSNAGFNKVFVGVETPNEESLVECNKFQNKNRDMISGINIMQNAGFQVMGGFIVGFDNDPKDIFDRQIGFIQKSGIVTAMVGLLHALPNTKLYERLKKEKRLTSDASGDNTDFSLNFIPKMNIDILIEGYKNLLKSIYSHKNYYKRIRTFFKEYKNNNKIKTRIRFNEIYAIFKSIIFLGILGKTRFQYWKLIISTMFKKPQHLSQTMTFVITGFHFQKILSRNLKRLENIRKENIKLNSKSLVLS
jgi:radical SAM superfamily enzyme YgiQ (UPF0313 family)